MKTNSQYPIIASSHIEQTLQFYTEVLGYHVKHTATTKLNTEVYVLANDNGQELDLIQATGPITPGLHGLRMNVKDIHTAYNEIQATNHKIVLEPVETNTGISFTFVDDNGIHITLIQHNKK